MKRLVVLLVGAMALGNAGVCADVIIDWNATAVTVQLKVGPTVARSGITDLTYMHVAIYDAVNAIDGRYSVFAVSPSNATPLASKEAAAAAAAHRVLVTFYPSQQTFLDSVYSAALALLPDGYLKSKGMAIGDTVATRFLQLRANDGRTDNISYTFSPPGPGVYELTPGAPPAATPAIPWLAHLRPFAILSDSQFRAPGPAPLTSDTYAEDFNEVKRYGSLDSTYTTPAQREIARFHTEAPNVQLARNIRNFAASRGLSLADDARLFAQLYVSIGDAVIAGWDSKFHYNFWRPVTAIREADIDGNSRTESDTSWMPLTATPNHPEYPSTHNCITGALATTLERFFGTPNVPITYTSTVTATQHSFSNVNQLVDEMINARVWGGMHFRSTNVAGIDLGRSVAEWVAARHFRPVNITQWTVQASGLPAGTATVDIRFAAINHNICWGVNKADNTSSNQFIRTTDGGIHWTASTVGQAPSGWRGSYIAAVDANTAWTAMHDPSGVSSGGVFKTTDGGASWTQQTTAFPGTGGNPRIIHFFDAQSGVCVGNPNGGNWEIYRTANGGDLWTRVPTSAIPPSVPGEVLFFRYSSAGNSLWFSTGDVTANNWALYRTTDRGITWTVRRLGGATSFPSFKDESFGLFARYSPRNQLLKTTDGGDTWSEIPVSLPFTIGAVFSVPGTEGSFVMTNYPIPGFGGTSGSAYTVDAGVTWTLIDNNVPRGPADFASPSAGWCGSEEGSIFKWIGDLPISAPIPTDGLQLWLRADVGVSLQGSTVARWIDQSGKGNDAFQEIGVRQPLLVSNVLNGRPVLRFDGQDDRLGLTGTTPMSRISLFVVERVQPGATGPNPNFPILLGDTALDGRVYGLAVQPFSGSPDTISCYGGFDSWVNGFTPDGGRYDQMNVVSIITDTRMWNTNLRVNGQPVALTDGGQDIAVSVTLGNSTGSGPGGIGGGDRVRVGRTVFKGDVAEVLVYNTVLSDSVRAVVEKYLTEKWLIPNAVADRKVRPSQFQLTQNYPNPFNPTTKIGFKISGSGLVTLNVYDILGREVATLVNEVKQPGSYVTTFNASGMASGVYFYRLTAGAYTETKRLVLSR